MPELLFTAAVIIIFIAIVSLLEHAVKTHGSLFAGIATPQMRLLALLLGFVFGLLFIASLIGAGSFDLTFFILTIALIGYSLSAGALLRHVQGEPATSPSKGGGGKAPPSDVVFIRLVQRIIRFLLIAAFVSALGILAIAVAMLVAAHPDHPLSILLIVGLIIFIAVGTVRGWLSLIIPNESRKP